MNNIKSYITVAALALSAAASAQNLNTGYFNEQYLYRHEINPAFGNEHGYIAMPVIGNLNLGFNSSIGVDDIFYNVNGKTSTFLHPQVDAKKFLKNIEDENKIYENMKMQILGAGFKSFGGYSTIDINLRQDLGLNLPGSLFRLAKEGLTNKSYDLSNTNAHMSAYAEIALGHSHEVMEGLRVGGKVKFLIGIANVDLDIEKGDITLDENEYTANINAKLQSSVKGMSYETEDKMRGPEGQQTKHTYVNDVDFDFDKVNPNGFGVAVDLGAEYKIDENWAVSASIIDLGFMNWSCNMLAETKGTKFSTKEFFIDPNDEDNTNAQLDKLEENLAGLYELQDKGDQGSRSTSLGATMNIGVQYTPAFYDKMSFGLMNATRFGDYGWTDFRLSANVAPCKIVSASASFGAGTYGASFGWLIDFHPKHFNLFLAMDRTLGKLAKPGIPKSLNGSVSMGINFPL